MFYLFKHRHKIASHIYFPFWCVERTEEISCDMEENLLFYEKFKQHIIITITKQYKHYWYFVFYFSGCIRRLLCFFRFWKRMLDFINIISAFVLEIEKFEFFFLSYHRLGLCIYTFHVSILFEEFLLDVWWCDS